MVLKEETDYFRELGPNGRNLVPSSPIGISTLPDQLVNLQVRKGFTLNIMCVGETGIGKTSLLHTLFRQPFMDSPHPARSPSVSISTKTYEMQEANVNLRVSFIESQGFGDQINKSESAKGIYSYIDEQFELYLKEEMKINRNADNFVDTRVHVCLYVISPTGHSLNALDINILKELQSRVNIIPIIGKADILTKSELKDFKAKVLSDLKENGINIYHFPLDDPFNSSKCSEMNEKVPFAIVSSCQEEVINGRVCRIRKYPWGTVVVDDNIHCEFLFLREMLLRDNLFDLINSTHYKWYEDYRIIRLSSTGITMDAEFAESLKRKRDELRNDADQQIKTLQEEFERNLKKLEENYLSEEGKINDEYSLNTKIIEARVNEKVKPTGQHDKKKKDKKHKS